MVDCEGYTSSSFKTRQFGCKITEHEVASITHVQHPRNFLCCAHAIDSNNQLLCHARWYPCVSPLLYRKEIPIRLGEHAIRT